MLRLLANDFRLNAVFVFWVFLLFNVQLVLMAWLGGPGKYLLSGLQSGIAFASAMVVAVFLREEQNRGQIINRSLPISHAKAVYARYLSVALFVIANMLYGMFYQRVVGLPEWISHMDLYFLFVVVMVGWSRCIPYLQRWSVSSALVFGSLGSVFLVVVFMIVILAVSIRLSTWLYARKEL
ncbi:MAG: ABC-2 transporter permease [Ignavibacteriales bacterium]|nr:ABC-2 transporter permease [Ignavibacteriales bacterium]